MKYFLVIDQITTSARLDWQSIEAATDAEAVAKAQSIVRQFPEWAKVGKAVVINSMTDGDAPNWDCSFLVSEL